MFRNTPDAPSGRLIEQAGCKGLAVGAARVSQRHANFFVNEGGARAADVLALVEQVRDAVRARGGGELELEVEVWGRDVAEPASVDLVAGRSMPVSARGLPTSKSGGKPA